jgi:hypothetical protein
MIISLSGSNKSFDRIQNISQCSDRKADDSNAGAGTCLLEKACSAVGMDVARYQPGALPRLVLLREFQEGDFDHAVDNFGDSVGLVADWLALARWWRSHSPAARSSRDHISDQPGNRSTSCLARRAKFSQSFNHKDSKALIN